MKIFVGCQKDAFNKSSNAIQKKYNIGQALISAVADKDDILLVMETHKSGNYCVYDTPGWELIDELQSVIDIMEEPKLNKLIAVASPALGCMDAIPAINSVLKENMQIELIGPLLDYNILHTIFLIKNTFPNIPISISMKTCGISNAKIRDHILSVLVHIGVIVKDL